MTNLEFAQVLPSYLGCEVQTKIRRTTQSGEPMKKLKGRFVGIDMFYGGERIDVLLENETDPANTELIYTSDCKLILRSTDQMTDEENDKKHKLYDATIGFQNLRGHITRAIPVINYLRSIGVDCDGILDTQFGIKQEIL